MPLSELEAARAKKTVGAYIERRRPPPHIRRELDLGYRISGQSIEIFEIRPVWKEPQEKVECAVAKATFVRTQGVWKVFWQRADLKWHSYEPVPEVSELSEFLATVEEDKHSCFWG